jgi:hypothetical protein
VTRVGTALANLSLVIASTLLTLLALELVLRALPIAWAPLVQRPTASDPIQRYVPNTPFTWSLDWNLLHPVRGRSNAQGFLADYDYDAAAATPLLAVVGDSMVEALRVPFAQTMTAHLQRMVGDRARVYAFAQSGSPLSQYAAYARHACETYRPQRLAVAIIGNDFDESLYEHRKRNGIYHLYTHRDGRLEHKLTPLPKPRLIERIARHSALALYLLRNAGLAGRLQEFGFLRANAADIYVGFTEAAADDARVNAGKSVIRWFLSALPQADCLREDQIVLAVDAARPQIYDPQALSDVQGSYFAQMRRYLIDEARARGYRVVDLQSVFQAAYARDGQPFEFPTDAHWNAHGHAVVARAIADALSHWPPLAASAK